MRTPLLLQLAEQVVEPDAVAADHDEIGQLQLPAEQLHVDHRPGWTISSWRPMVVKPSARLNVVTLPDPGPSETRERGRLRTGAGIRSGCRPRIASTRPTSRYSVRPISLFTFTASRACTVARASSRRGPPSPTDHRRDELVEREDRRRREAGQHDDRLAAGRGQTDRLAGLERDAVRDDPGIGQLGDDAIGDVAGAFARAAREQHDVGDRRAPRAPSRAARSMSSGDDAEPTRLAAQLAHGVGEHLRVRVVDARRLHRLAGRDDLVAGREDRDDRLAPDVDRRRRRSPRARRCRGWSGSCRAAARSRRR